MRKTPELDNTFVLQMALVGYELEHSRIEAAMNQIRAELGQGSTRTPAATPTASAEPKTTGRKRFSSAARKRMAAAQKKRWAELKAAKAEGAKPKRKLTVKRPAQVKASKKVAPTPKARKVAHKVRKAPVKPAVQNPVAAVQPTEATPTEVMA